MSVFGPMDAFYRAHEIKNAAEEIWTFGAIIAIFGIVLTLVGIFLESFEVEP